MDDKRYRIVVDTLNRLTKEKTIQWEADKAPDLYAHGRDNIIIDFYTTTLPDGQKWGIGEFRYRVFDSDTESYHWTNDIRLFMYDRTGFEVWDLPDIPGTFYILDEIRYQKIDVDGRLDSFMKNYGNK